VNKEDDIYADEETRQWMRFSTGIDCRRILDAEWIPTGALDGRAL